MSPTKCSNFLDCFCHRPGLVLLLLPCLLILTLYFISINEVDYDHFQFTSSRFSNYSDAEVVDGFLVWNPKCHMVAKPPFDPSILGFVKKEKFEPCSTSLPLTKIVRETNGTITLNLDEEVSKTHRNGLTCCWTSIVRPEPKEPLDAEFDSVITAGKCQEFAKSVVLPRDLEVVMVSCREKVKGKSRVVYENVHPILNPEKVEDRYSRSNDSVPTPTSSTSTSTSTSTSPSTSRMKRPRKLSILVLGLDSVSRLNFQRTMPRTENYLRENGWFTFKGYNKMGENTFPNLMAILTGQNQSDSYSRCKPKVPYGLDKCPILWYNFRNAGYVTAYGEDECTLNTFNYLKVGFVKPPTDYYLRPYILASEKFLKVRRRFSTKYCTGPELSAERIFKYALDFAQTFIGVPYFGFFWTNSLSHDSMNGPSSMDARITNMFEILERTEVLNDTMVVFLSDHGMRYGSIRSTFIGWYEERLPFIYLWLPEWFREENPEAVQSLMINENRLASPFDLYETFRDVLTRADGEAPPSPGCPTCNSLFQRIPRERGCQDAGVSAHWCTCTVFQSENTEGAVEKRGAEKFLSHVEDVIKNYKDKKGRRLCSKLSLKKIHRVDRVVNFNSSSKLPAEYFYMIEVSPGGGRYEVTVHHHGNDNYTILDEEVSRINSYASSAKCLHQGMKSYCHCIK